MSFNPLMTLLARGLVDLSGEESGVVELGNQTLNTDTKALRTVIARSLQHPRIDISGLQELAGQSSAERGPRTADYWRMLGFKSYEAIDINDTYGSLVMDLNQDLREANGYQKQFTLVTNNGTGEHIFNQHAVFLNVHQLTVVSGLMIHVLPFVEYINHGLYSFHPNLFTALAQANQYQLLALGIATRDGYGIVAPAAGEDKNIPKMLYQEQRVPLSDLLVDAKPPKANIFHRIIFRLLPKDSGRKLHQKIHRLQGKRPKLLLFAISRKLKDTPFCMPIQSRYEDSIQDSAMLSKYTGSQNEHKTP